MSRRQRRAGGRTVGKVGGGVRKKAARSATRAEKRRLQVVARRAATEAARRRAPRHVTVLGAGTASRANASTFAAKLAAEAGIVARGVSSTNLTCALDEALIADTVIVLFEAGEREPDDVSVSQLVAVRSQGLPPVLAVASGADAADKPLRRHRARVLAAYSLGEEIDLRTLAADTIPMVARRLTERAPRDVVWRSRYGYLAVDKCAPPRPDAPRELVVSGWLRGRGLSANELVHISGLGTYVCRRVVDEKTEAVLSERVEAEAEDPASEVVPDTTMGEQTWIPEMEGDGDEFFAEGEDDDEDDDMVDGGDEAPDMEKEQNMDGEGSVESDIGEDMHAADELIEEDDDEMDVDEDELKRLRESAQTDAEFPDEVDTPIDQPARVRFARYRGLQSFRTSEWDPKEQLPREYATLFQFRNLKSTRKRVLAQAKATAAKPNVPNFAKPGGRVRVHLINVEPSDAQKIIGMVTRGEIVVLSGMLKHENKRSVVHFGVTRIDDEEEDNTPIKAKTPMVMRAGFVRFDGRPMFSEHNSNSDKHKMNRFLTHGRYTVATFYGPCVYAPAPALLFRAEGGLVAAGSTLGSDPDRIILKRIVLTGFPYKTQKKKSVAKFMFFNPEDIRWFKPVEMWTKMGRTGHILEPMGTKGHMKCTFDSALLHHDTICMTLYKRVYPKLLDAPIENSA